MSDPLVRIADELAGIRQVLELLLVDGEPETATRCEHPRERRVPFGVTNGSEDWQCRDCGYRVSEVQPS